MSLPDHVRCATDVTVAQRGVVADDTVRSVLRVAANTEVQLPSGPSLEARTADGSVWRRQWAEPHRLVIEYVGIAIAVVDDHDGTVAFDRDLPAEMEEHLVFDHVLPLVLARRGNLVLHGAVISLNGQAAVLVGDTGSGKSTLTAFAWTRGWTVGGDDGAVLFASQPPSVEPTYATVRLTPAGASLLGVDLASVSNVVGKLRVRDDPSRPFQLGRTELRVIAILEPAPDGTSPHFERLGGLQAHAALFGSTFHADLSADRQLPATVKQLADIVDHAPVGHLAVPRGLEGLDRTQQLLRQLVQLDHNVTELP